MSITFSFVAIAAAFVGGYLANFARLTMEGVARHKHKIIALAVIYLAILVLEIVLLAMDFSLGTLIFDVSIMIALPSAIFFVSFPNKEEYLLREKIKQIPEVKRRNRWFIVFLIVYMAIPVIALSVAMILSEGESVYIPPRYSGLGFLIALFYIGLFFFSLAFFSAPFRKHYQIEKDSPKTIQNPPFEDD